MMFHEFECGVIINLSMIVEIDKTKRTMVMASGDVWKLNDEELDAIINRIGL